VTRLINKPQRALTILAGVWAAARRPISPKKLQIRIRQIRNLILLAFYQWPFAGMIRPLKLVRGPEPGRLPIQDAEDGNGRGAVARSVMKDGGMPNSLNASSNRFRAEQILCARTMPDSRRNRYGRRIALIEALSVARRARLAGLCSRPWTAE